MKSRNGKLKIYLYHHLAGYSGRNRTEFHVSLSSQVVPPQNLLAQQEEVDCLTSREHLCRSGAVGSREVCSP